MNKIIGANRCLNLVGGGCGGFSYCHLVNIEFNGWNMTLLTWPQISVASTGISDGGRLPIPSKINPSSRANLVSDSLALIYHAVNLFSYYVNMRLIYVNLQHNYDWIQLLNRSCCMQSLNWCFTHTQKLNIAYTCIIFIFLLLFTEWKLQLYFRIQLMSGLQNRCKDT